VALVYPWAIVGNSRKYEREGADIDVGWVWELARGAERRTLRVEVAAGLLVRTDLPSECRRTIRDRGRSESSMYLSEDAPPTRIFVTTSGLMVERE
jgi:hypothetical protein